MAAAGAAFGAANTPPVDGQTDHKPYIPDLGGQLEAVKQDLLDGSGMAVTDKEAKNILHALHVYTGTGSKKIRSAYKKGGIFHAQMEAVDTYVKGAPKWQGTVHRGINVSLVTARDILSGETVDMLGPSSWSSEMRVAEKFARGKEEVSMIFTLPENKSGASVTHIGTYDGVEAEVLAPSGVQYIFDNARECFVDGVHVIYVDVHEK